MIEFWIYLSGVLLSCGIFIFLFFVKKTDLRKRDIIRIIFVSLLSYATILIILYLYYVDEHGDEIVFNFKNKEND